MRLFRIVAVVMLTFYSSRVARAQDVQVELDCWAPYQVTAGASSTAVPSDDRSTGITWAINAVDQTTTTNAVQSMGFEFAWADGAQMQCTTILPSSYGTGATPEVTIVGWPIEDGEFCEPNPDPPCDGCSTAFGFLVSSRSYSAGDMADAAWSTPVTGLIEGSCPWSDPIDRVRTVAVAAAPSGSSWAADDLLFIRIQRDEPYWPHVTFHVASVKLRFRVQ